MTDTVERLRVDQTQFGIGNDRANCMQAALATLLRLPLCDVIDITDPAVEPRWHDALEAWGAAKGYTISSTAQQPREGYYIACGPVERCAGRHAVVCFGDDEYHDPHPSRAGLISADYYIVASRDDSCDDPAEEVANEITRLRREGKDLNTQLFTARIGLTQQAARIAEMEGALKAYIDDCTYEECEFCERARESLAKGGAVTDIKIPDGMKPQDDATLKQTTVLSTRGEWFKMHEDGVIYRYEKTGQNTGKYVVVAQVRSIEDVDWIINARTRTTDAARIAQLEVENARLREAFTNPPKHVYWMAGEEGCPREIKASNGELHTLRCKVCGLENPRNQICRSQIQSLGGA